MGETANERNGVNNPRLVGRKTRRAEDGLAIQLFRAGFLIPPRHDESAEIRDSFYEAPARLEGCRQLIRAAFGFDPAYRPKKAVLRPHQHSTSPSTSRDKIDIDPGRLFIGELGELLDNGQLRRRIK